MNEPVKMPFKAESLEVLLVENGAKTRAFYDILPESSGVFATFPVNNCPVRKALSFKSKLPIGRPGAANEGEGGLIAEVSREGNSFKKTLVFPKVPSWVEVVNGQGEKINVGKTEMEGFFSEQNGSIMSTELSAELSSGLAWGVSYIK
jgi:hypothetical protein